MSERCAGPVVLRGASEARRRLSRLASALEDLVEDAVDVVQHGGDGEGDEYLGGAEDVVLVELVADVEREVHHPREERVHRADVVQHVPAEVVERDEGA